MIRRLQGQLVDLSSEQIVLDINGVGYLVAAKINQENWQLGEQVTLYTHLAVRETALDLYGFATTEELEIFELLLTLPKIGPRSAMQIMSQADISLLKKAVAEQDASYLAKMSGIGKKSAEKIVLGLKDKLNYETLADMSATSSENVETTDTIDALITLGYSEQSAREVVRELRKNQPAETDTRTLIKDALKLLNR